MDSSYHTTVPLYSVNQPGSVGSLVDGIVESGAIASGNYVAEFEEAFGEVVANRAIVATKDVSTTLAMALTLAGVRAGDEVLASPMGCLSTTMPVLNIGAKVRWVDIDPRTGNMDPADLERAVGPRTKAILVYHWVGYPAPLPEIERIARSSGIPIVDDAGEALGASLNGRPLGSIGSDYTAFSFYPNRHLMTIEGGALAVHSTADLERARSLSRYGIHQPSFRRADGEINPDSDIVTPGFSNGMTNISAAIGMASLTRLKSNLGAVARNAAMLTDAVEEAHSVRPLQLAQGASASPWVFSVLANDRTAAMERLRERGVQASQVHLRNDVYSCFGPPQRSLSGVDEFSQKTLSVPCGAWLTASDLTTISRALQA